MTFGDSKTARNEWQPVLIKGLADAGYSYFISGNAGRSNGTVADSVPGTPGTGVDHMITSLPADMQEHPELAGYVLMNWGVNDMANWPLNQATWEAEYGEIVEWAHALYPNAKIYLSYPWRQSFDAIAATMHGWVDNVIAAHQPYTFAGVDEAITIKRDDDGASATSGGVHYSVPFGATVYAEESQVRIALQT